MAEQSPLELGLECLKAGNFDDAITYLEQATALNPNDVQGFNYLGVAYGRNGLYDRAVGAFQMALQLRADIPSIHLNLGLVYQADQFLDRAREQFQRALELDPAYEKASAALEALEAEGIGSPPNQSCARHPDEPAVAVCSFCHLPVCEQCETITGSQVYCRNGATNLGLLS